MTKTHSTRTDRAHAPHDAAERLAGKYLTFFLGDEEYGIEILKVHEIVGLLRITPVPNVPASLRGVVNLRGKVIPVVDLRARFGMGSVETTRHTCIVFVDAGGAEMGVLVDRVNAVVDVLASEIDATPTLGAGVRTDHLLGLAKAEGRVRLLVDIERALSISDAAVREVAAPLPSNDIHQHSHS